MHIERGRRVGTEPDIDRMAERKLAGESHHDVPGLPHIGEVENEDQDREQVIVCEQRRDDERDEQRGNEHESALRHPFEQSTHDARLPRMPWGRNNRTSTRIANANMLFADGVNMRPASASVMPISTPPRSAPGIEPRPPVMTMTKASSVY